MNPQPFHLFPESASAAASQVDLLFWALVGLCAVFALAVGGFTTYCVVKYRHSNEACDRQHVLEDSVRLESLVIGGLLALSVGAFVWAALLYFDLETPPVGTSLDLYGTGKQWMWKFEHPNGAREINTLHVPVGQDVRLILTSEDVIHSFYVPAFRLKQDVLPGRYTNVWFEATKPGRYRLFCAEYCGTDHAAMNGWVEVMTPGDYERWLDLGATGSGEAHTDATTMADSTGFAVADSSATPGRLAAEGAALFVRLRCATCHRPDSSALYPARGPALDGVYGRPVRLSNERTVLADEQYLRESILDPQAKLVQGYPPIMPTYRGQLSEGDLRRLIAYLKELGDERSERRDRGQPLSPTPEPR